MPFGISGPERRKRPVFGCSALQADITGRVRTQDRFAAFLADTAAYRVKERASGQCCFVQDRRCDAVIGTHFLTKAALRTFCRENSHMEYRRIIIIPDPVDGLRGAGFFTDAACIASFKKLRCHPAEGLFPVRFACGCKKPAPESGRTCISFLLQKIVCGSGRF